MAIASVAGRELLGAMLPDTRGYYVLTILIVYGVAIYVGFHLQESLTFARVPAARRRASAVAFCAVVTFVGFLTAGLAYVLRYPFGFDELFRPYGGAASYALATLITSVVSYGLSARFVFVQHV